MSEFFQMMQWALPEMIVLVTACLALLADLFLRTHVRSVAYVCSMTGLLLAAVTSFLFIGQYESVYFHGLFISDDIGSLMKLAIYIAVALSFFYSRHYLDERQMPEADYYVLGLFSTLGMMTLVSAHSMLTIYLGLELLSLPLYAMTAIRRTNSDASEAAMKYFAMGAIASGMLLYGISLVYAGTGKLDLHEIAQVITLNWASHQGILSFGLVFILAGIGFKLAAVPFHMWAPDVYQGAPTAVTLFISTAPKVAAVGMLFRVLIIALPGMTLQWQPIIAVMALLSAGFGNLLAVAQTNLKRLFAYSAISHMGYALFGVLAATPNGYAASLYYVFVYVFMSAGAFGLLVLLSRGGFEVEEMTDLKGLNKRNPWLALMMMMILLSMAGIPPLVGFFTKLLVLKALVDVGMTWVAVIGLLFAVIGAFYYLRIIKVMYFDEVSDSTRIHLPVSAQLVFSVNGLALLYLGLFPGALIAACMNAFH